MVNTTDDFADDLRYTVDFGLSRHEINFVVQGFGNLED
jgi:hypothetical protein